MNADGTWDKWMIIKQEEKDKLRARYWEWAFNIISSRTARFALRAPVVELPEEEQTLDEQAFGCAISELGESFSTQRFTIQAIWEEGCKKSPKLVITYCSHCV